MKELDVTLTGYLENHYEQAEATEQENFRSLLVMKDRELFELFIGHTQAEDATTADIISKMWS